MSGGVDSSVAALLLKREGHEVIGVFMNNWNERGVNGECGAESDWDDVRRVCDIIGIPYYSIDFSEEYMDRVFANFLSAYEKGKTPNPDVLCNREIKFSRFLELAESLGADNIATGHFARVSVEDGSYKLLRAIDANKDQTYFLYMLGQRALGKAIFPIGTMLKGDVRSIAREYGLPIHNKKDSTGICFIGERNFKRFLSRYLPARPGDITGAGGQIIGRHDGLMYYTIGQRRGLGIGGGGDGRRWFVVGKDISNNVLLVDQGEDSPFLYSKTAAINELHWISGNPPAPPGEERPFKARLRHRQPLIDAVARIDGETMRIQFRSPQRAVTPGQAAVLYCGDICLGGGTII
jgi:tRNA-specific 2-thiouridylase